MTEDNVEFLSWEDEIQTSKLPEKAKHTLIKYMHNQKNSGFPLIWELKHFAYIVNINTQILSNIINSTEYFYRSFNIPKKRGGHRNISSPYPALLDIQHWILSNILKNIKLSAFSHGYIENKSIITNATEHLGNSHLLKIDIKDFFPSIPINRVIAVFQNCGYPNHIAYMLARVCCLDNSLPQGASTSPYLSNIILKRLDNRVNGLSAKFSLKYTRYADDICVSGKHIPIKLIEYIYSIIEDEGFIANKEKTILIRGKGKKIVTGISISNNELKLPRSTKRKLRQEVHYLSTRGFFEHTNHLNRHDPLYIERILGKLQFWKSIEPNNEYVVKSINLIKTLQNTKY
ncbi:MAG: retron St85 family RNA-directed DNA polymerase [Gammaproteobacteria bacterium]|nr:retron St85 family RNA-directed DNA polymerase [Gammaproteobacteria bacterium]